MLLLSFPTDGEIIFLFIAAFIIILFLGGLILSGIYIIYKSVSSEKKSYQGKFNVEVNDE